MHHPAHGAAPLSDTAGEPCQVARTAYTADGFAQAKAFVFHRWCELATEQAWRPPSDLSGACKYGSLFVREVFGGVIQGHYAHQFNRLEGRLVDLSHDALDVGRMSQPYLNDATYFEIPEYQQQLAACMPRVQRWVTGFMQTQRAPLPDA
jgi:hypothetical protein